MAPRKSTGNHELSQTLILKIFLNVRLDGIEYIKPKQTFDQIPVAKFKKRLTWLENELLHAHLVFVLCFSRKRSSFLLTRLNLLKQIAKRIVIRRNVNEFILPVNAIGRIEAFELIVV